MELVKRDFDIIREYVLTVCGISIDDNKEYLVRQRLESVAQSQGCRSFQEFAMLLRAFPDPAVRDQVVAAITTNETSFFRDGHPYELFRSTTMPGLVSIVQERKKSSFGRRGAKISILSAGSSTGQEPYSLSIVINEYLQFNRDSGLVPDDFVIVATDVSSRVLAQAIAGEYTNLEAHRGLSDAQRGLFISPERERTGSSKTQSSGSSNSGESI
jgi:chemotaxis protein methyltransferase CheR